MKGEEKAHKFIEASKPPDMWDNRQENPEPWGSTGDAQKDRQHEESKWLAQVKSDSEFRDSRVIRQVGAKTMVWQIRGRTNPQLPSQPGYTLSHRSSEQAWHSGLHFLPS